MINILYQKKLFFVGVVFLVCAIVTVLVLLTPSTKNVAKTGTKPEVTPAVNLHNLPKENGELTVLDLVINAQGQTISGINATLAFDATKLHFVDFKQENALDSVLINYSQKLPYKLQIVAIDTKNKAINQRAVIGHLYFQGNKEGISTLKTTALQLVSSNTTVNSNLVQIYLYSKLAGINIPLNVTQTNSVAPDSGTMSDQIVNVSNCLLNKPECTDAIRAQSDINHDGVIDNDDLNILQRRSLNK